ncbi:hypothetical protein [Proteiniborus sp. MB09-C3]|uniref:hypothetical protein n=1 Tax=Proteiniborus sp. MB09-C3 TaxID=3050072 RepID=UPI002554D46A|nr:hypothetical protein [Proteiniborus sp. MB09-C3]WIV13504.1 hypothetical protein QO263_07295 [Proteiniborus sp. MB09-C3]
MKKNISKIVSFSSKNSKILVLTILLLISAFYNIKLKNELDKFLIKGNIKGTYGIENGNQQYPEYEYFVFITGNFYRYKQFEMLDEGTYENIYDNIYILKSDNTDEYIIYSNEKFHFYDRKRSDVLAYSRVSYEPLFVNVKRNR